MENFLLCNFLNIRLFACLLPGARQPGGQVRIIRGRFINQHSTINNQQSRSRFESFFFQNLIRFVSDFF
jgi:hypothetical protein